MSVNDQEKARSTENRSAIGDQSESKNEAGYEVGYGKPPKQSQFAKGKSGNPRGRPKKKDKRPIRFSDAMSERFLEEEAYRTVTLRENGQPIELPVVQAIMRSLVTEGIKGKRLHQKYAIDMIMEFEKLKYQAKLDRYIRLQELKREGEEQIERHKRKNLPPPELLPHPDDIMLNPMTGEAFISGPQSKEDLAHYEQSVQLRDHLVLQSVHAKKNRRIPLARCEDKEECLFLVAAHLVNHFLPARYQWKEIDAISLMMEYESMAKRERVRLVNTEFARLEAEWLPLRGITPEAAEVLEQVRKQWLDGGKSEHRP